MLSKDSISLRILSSSSGSTFARQGIGAVKPFVVIAKHYSQRVVADDYQRCDAAIPVLGDS